ncbi:glycosyltransferase family 4 protein [Gluconacetobacter diazotrophicus]|uniref:Glycosyltransferase family 4 protein n=2 Tax=Gluconacetobacter diazotrophicus TaxID=33996 RepID=A0A7W4I4V9_GLUDI|nr:glycosyltransferase family 1 protein [Gluconacetobacter diazotrophicus]MBB2156304.1 glycosyltransferase family 4 protein [Gluconacetobacter diazotrophicus]CAP56344.1 putative glycosyl transferase, group 1 [Gluconacetobacter diazotrophicus PA1 5]
MSDGPVIWLDGRNAKRAGGTGVARYTQAIAECLEQAGLPATYLTDQVEGAPIGHPHSPARQVWRAVQTLRPAYPATIRRDGRAPYAVCPDIFRIAHVRFKLWGALATVSVPTPPDIMHWTYPLPIRMKGARNVVTIHDVVPLTHPELTGIDPDRYRRLLRRLVRSADAVVTISESARRDIATQCDVPLSHIHNLFQTAGFSADELRQAGQVLPPAPPGYFLHVGRVEGRKNICRLVAAHARSGTRRPLVLIGPDGDDRPDYAPFVGDTPVLRLPWCDQPGLIRAIQDAHGLLFPSLAEGFGLPIVEAMALGTPVLTARGGATEEIAADAAILVDPLDIDDIARGIRTLDGLGETSALRLALQGKGRLRASRFSRAAYTERLRQFYCSLL